MEKVILEIPKEDIKEVADLIFYSLSNQRTSNSVWTLLAPFCEDWSGRSMEEHYAGNMDSIHVDVHLVHPRVLEIKRQKPTLVKYNYNALPEEWRNNNPNIYEGIVFMNLGEVEGMEGHSYLQNIEDGRPYILDTDNLIEVSTSKR